MRSAGVERGAADGAETMQASRATATTRYLVVGEPPEKLWPLVSEFWQENGFLITVEMPGRRA